MDQHSLAMAIDSTGSNEPPCGASATHWLSYNCYEGHKTLREKHGNEYLVSIVLDAGSHESLSNVRVIIFNKVDELGPDRAGYSTQTLRDLVDFGRLAGLMTHGTVPITDSRTYGDMLRKHRTRKGTEGCAQSRMQVDNLEDTLTLIFELGIDSKNSRGAMLYCSVRARGDPGHQPIDSPSQPFVVAYDRTWNVSSSNRSLMLYLDFGILSWLFPTNMNPFFPIDLPLPTYEVRILPPPHRRRYTAPDLPPSIVKLIVSHTLGLPYLAKSWKATLLSYALIRKSWWPALEIFFENIGCFASPEGHHDIDMGDPLLIAKSLRARPEKGSLIKGYGERIRTSYLRGHFVLQDVFPEDLIDSDPDNLHQGYPYVIDREGLQRINAACKEIIRYGFQSIETLNIGQDFFWEVRDVLRDMAVVKSATFLLERSSEQLIPNKHDTVSVASVQDTIENWNKLKRLTLEIISKVPRPQTEPTTVDGQRPPTTPNYCLESLSLTHISGLGRRDLLGFINPSAPSSLQELKLANTTIRNQDLYDFLRTVQSSLSTIQLSDVRLQRDLSGEPHAVERAIPHLKALTTLEIMCTPPTTGPMGTFSGPLLSGPPINPNRPKIMRRLHLRGVPMGSDQLPLALETSTWEHIEVLQHFGEGPPAAIIQAAKEVAERRGIKLVVL